MEDNKPKYNSIDMPWGILKKAICGIDSSMIENFDEVIMQFTESIGGKELQKEMEVIKEEVELEAKITLALLLIEKIRLDGDMESFEQLKGLRYHMMIPSVNLDDPIVYCTQIQGYINLDIINLKELRIDKARNVKNPESVRYTMDYFTDMELEIASALSIRIDDNSTGRQYCRAVVKYKEYVAGVKRRDQNKKKQS